MKLREYPRSAMVEILANRSRCALSCVSLSIGIAAVLFTLSQVASMSQRMKNALELAGPGRLVVMKKEDYVSKGLSPGLTVEDALAIRAQFPEIHMVYPLAMSWGVHVRHRDFHTEGAMTIGTTPEYTRRDWVYTLRGRFLNDEDVRTAARVCVLVQPGGWGKKGRPVWARFRREEEIEKPLKHREMLGADIAINDHTYKVVGIIRAPPRDKDPRWFTRSYSSGGGTAIIPVSTFQKYFVSEDQSPGSSSTRIEELEIDTGRENGGAYARQIEALLITRHRGEKDFDITDFREMIRGALKRNREAALAVLIIGIVAIVTGGIGIMNVTLATVFSRIREIGIRRALGATRLEIIAQFTTEATLLGLFGGAAGLPLGVAAARYMATDPDHLVMPGVLHLTIAMAIAVGTGFLFSVYPAWQAAKLDPIEALRYE